MTRIAFGGLLLLLGLALPAPAPARPFDPFRQAGIAPRPGARVPLDGAFRDSTGAPVTLRQLAEGKPIVLVPVLHHCPNICGVTLGGLVQAIRAQDFRPGRDFTVIAFGIDPREGPAAARASRAALAQAPPALDAGVHAVTGSRQDIAAVTGALGFRYAWDPRLGQYAHVAATAVLTADGRLTRWLYGLQPAPTDLRLALTEAGEGRLGDWGDQLLLLCYHYDPETGRYGSLVWWLLRLGGGITAAAGAGLIGMALWRDRRAGRRGG